MPGSKSAGELTNSCRACRGIPWENWVCKGSTQKPIANTGYQKCMVQLPPIADVESHFVAIQQQMSCSNDFNWAFEGG